MKTAKTMKKNSRIKKSRKLEKVDLDNVRPEVLKRLKYTMDKHANIWRELAKH